MTQPTRVTKQEDARRCARPLLARLGRAATGAAVPVTSGGGDHQRRFSTMRDVHRRDPVSASPGRGAVFAAWERFVQGEDHVPGIRPEVAISWHPCREQYRVDPHLTEAPSPSRSSTTRPSTMSCSLSWLSAPPPWRTTWATSEGRHRHRRHRPDPGRVGRPRHDRQGDRLQPRALVQLVRVRGRYERHGHGARGARPGGDRRRGALVPGVPQLGLRRHRGAGRGDQGADRGPEHLLLAQPASRVRERVADERRRHDPAHVEAPRPGQRRRAGRGLHRGRGPAPARRSPPWTPQARW